MSMFCFQCQETAKGSGCTIQGVCGKTEDTCHVMDGLIYVTKGLAQVLSRMEPDRVDWDKVGKVVFDGLFSTITNANFDNKAIFSRMKVVMSLRDEYRELSPVPNSGWSEQAIWWPQSIDDVIAGSEKTRVTATENEDIRSLRELLIYGIKGISAYMQHARVLGKDNPDIIRFVIKGLNATLNNTLSVEDLVALVTECGETGVSAMTLLDEANTITYGYPEMTRVNIGTGNRPGILVSGHDLKDLEMLLEQSQNSGIDIYTHGEMLPAHYYPFFKKYAHFHGNYGGSWWKQGTEFAAFNGPILMTTNCIIPVKKEYLDRIYTTGSSGYSDVPHIDADDKGWKDFSDIIEQARKSTPPKELEQGEIIGGFAHRQILEFADKIIEGINSGVIKKFIVMAGCDGRMKNRSYYTEFAEELPENTIILTAGCAKYRYNKLHLGNINGIPRVLDAGQCNDSYSLAVVALKLKEVLGLKDINDLPIVYNIAWYEQKAVIVLLALLSLGVKNIHLGPTLPGFLSPHVANVLINQYGISGIQSVKDDVELLLQE